MDQSYWSKFVVVNATRDFVCIRLATYEDAEEVEFLKKIFTGRSGELENTVFALLDADGTTKLSRSGRSPDFAFWGANSFADAMEKISAKRKVKDKRFTDDQLPLMKNVKLGLNVASCDRIQLIAIVGESDEKVKELSKKALPLAWNEKIGGQFVFVTAKTPAEIKPLGMEKVKDGIYVINPDEFGISGKLVAKFNETLDIEQTTEKLAKLSADYKVTKNYRQHIDSGIRQGIEWKTETPVTDQQSLRALKHRRGSQKKRGR